MRLLTFLLAFLQLAGCNNEADPRFPENQRIDGPLEVGRDWQAIEFSPPLVVNRNGLQGLHFVVDEKLYRPNSHYDIDDYANQSNLRRNDGVLIKPEVILIGENGEEFVPMAVSNTHLYAGGLTIGFGTFGGQFSPAPVYPEGIQEFKAMRIRSNVPFTAHYLEWRMDIPFPDPD